MGRSRRWDEPNEHFIFMVRLRTDVGWDVLFLISITSWLDFRVPRMTGVDAAPADTVPGRRSVRVDSTSCSLFFFFRWLQSQLRDYQYSSQCACTRGTRKFGLCVVVAGGHGRIVFLFAKIVVLSVEVPFFFTFGAGELHFFILVCTEERSVRWSTRTNPEV